MIHCLPKQKLAFRIPILWITATCSTHISEKIRLCGAGFVINKFEKKKKSSLFHVIYLIAKWIWLRSIVGNAFKNSPLLSNVIYLISSSCLLHASASEKWFDLLVFSLPFSKSVWFRPQKYWNTHSGAARKYRNHHNVIRLSWKIIVACQFSHFTSSMLSAHRSDNSYFSFFLDKNDWIFRLVPVTWLSMLKCNVTLIISIGFYWKMK